MALRLKVDTSRVNPSGWDYSRGKNRTSQIDEYVENAGSDKISIVLDNDFEEDICSANNSLFSIEHHFKPFVNKINSPVHTTVPDNEAVMCFI